MLRRTKRFTKWVAFLLAILASFLGGAIIETLKPFAGRWLPWAPGGLTVAIRHGTAQQPLLAAGEVSRLVLKRDGQIVEDVDSPQTALSRFCSLTPGRYSVSAWANDMLAVTACPVEVKPHEMVALDCTVERHQARLRVKVIDGREAAVADVRVRVLAHTGKQWREEPVDPSGVSPVLFLQPTMDNTGQSYSVQIVRGGEIIAEQRGIRLASGEFTIRVVDGDGASREAAGRPPGW